MLASWAVGPYVLHSLMRLEYCDTKMCESPCVLVALMISLLCWYILPRLIRVSSPAKLNWFSNPVSVGSARRHAHGSAPSYGIGWRIHMRVKALGLQSEKQFYPSFGKNPGTSQSTGRIANVISTVAPAAEITRSIVTRGLKPYFDASKSASATAYG